MTNDAFNMSGANAAVIAERAYAVAAARSNLSPNVKADADDIALNTGTFRSNPVDGPALSVPVSPVEAVVAKSGAFVRETRGFGVLLERHGAQDREFIFAMRGTMPPKLISKDWLTNYRIGLTPGPTGSLVHSGFMSIYTSMRQEVAQMIARVKPKRIHFVGHSLGGALATLAAIDYKQNGSAPTHLYTFGAPRIGSGGLVADVQRLIGAERHKRVYSISDPVPMIPMTPFCHVPDGSIGLSDNMSVITAGAHSMLDNYVPQMQKLAANDWPPETRLPMKSDPGYWLTRAEQNAFIGSSIGYFCLAKALRAILYAGAHVLSAGLTAFVTLADILFMLIDSGAKFAERIGGLMVRFARAALKIAGVVGRYVVNSAADLTVAFLKYVLDLVLRPIRMAAVAAGNLIK